MPGYRPQVKSENGEMVDIPIAATYDENGNEIKKYVSTFLQTFTEEQKAQARANIGAVSASETVTTLYDHYIKAYSKYTSGNIEYIFTFVIRTKDKTPFTFDSLIQWLKDRNFYFYSSTFGGGTYKDLNFFFPLFFSFLSNDDDSINTVRQLEKPFAITVIQEQDQIYLVVCTTSTISGSNEDDNRLEIYKLNGDSTILNDNVIGAYGEIVE